VRLRSSFVVAIVAVVMASCAGSSTTPRGDRAAPSSFETPFADDKVYPTLVSSEISVGPNRFLVGLLNNKDAPVGSPKVRMHISFFDLDRSSTEPVSQTDMKWMWITRPYLGLYRGRASFDHAGKWGAEVRVEGSGLRETVRSSFEVKTESLTPGLGEKVPGSDTPTARGSEGLKKISTDAHPDPRFYDKSIAEALDEHQPFVVTFATPKFCTSQVCGPMLDNVKEVARQRRDVTFIHVEPYRLPADPANLQPVPAALEWGLPNEPWTFVVDGRGRLVAKYEGAVTPAELRAELRRLP
jgi:hypothetical protein